LRPEIRTSQTPMLNVPSTYRALRPAAFTGRIGTVWSLQRHFDHPGQGLAASVFVHRATPTRRSRRERAGLGGAGWIVPERHLLPRRRARGMEIRQVEGQPEVPEHPRDGVTRCERGGDLHAAFAAGALEDVGQEDDQIMDAGEAPPLRLLAGDAAIRARRYTWNRGDDGRHDSGAAGERRGKDAEVAREVCAWCPCLQTTGRRGSSPSPSSVRTGEHRKLNPGFPLSRPRTARPKSAVECQG